MNVSTSMVIESVFPRYDLSCAQSFLKAAALVSCLLLMLGVIHAQESTAPQTADNPIVVEGVSDTIVYSVGHSLKINGTVKNGAIALGGDVIVQGNVDGDVAAIGGSVIQLEGARISGDVMVVGGSYKHLDKVPNRNPAAMTLMYAGYEQELRNMMRNPTDLLAPRWSAKYIGFRILAVLFWFVVSLGLTAAMPGTISRGIARLQLTLGRVAIIGVIGSLLIGPGVLFGLRYLPYMIGVVVGLLALLFILIAGLFGRVIIYAATGRWLQRKVLGLNKSSESVALLLGTTFWIGLSSLPYIWPIVVAVVVVTSVGLALTARYRVGWKRQEAAS
jgi:hypothetical protein